MKHGSDNVIDDYERNVFRPDEIETNSEKEQTIQELLNYGNCNRHEIKAGETWKYHFDEDCTVILVFK